MITRLRAIPARVRALDPFRFDVLLASLFAVGGVIEALFLVDANGDSRAVTAVAGVLVSVAAVWRRRAPLVTAAVFPVVCVADTLLGGFIIARSTLPFVLLLFVLYSVGRWTDGRLFWVCVALLLPGTYVSILLDADEGAGVDDLVWAFVLFVPPLLGGRAMRSRVLLQEQMREKARRYEEEREERARQARDDERDRLAAELQAVVANSVTAMVVQAEAIPRVLEAGDGASARQALGVIEETGRDALSEMRRLLGVLRRGDQGAELAPQPTLAEAAALVDRAREDGVEVELSVEGPQSPLAAGVDLAAYRILQQALAAAAAAGASRAEVRIRFGEPSLSLHVRDDRAAGSGDDRPELMAMRERAGLYGGHVQVEREAQDGYSVDVRLPREGAMA